MIRPNSIALRILFTLLACSLWIYSFAQSPDWNTGTGGNSARNSLSTQCGPASVDILWDESLPSVIAFQAKMDSNIVVTSRILDLSNTLDGTLIVAHDLLSGDTLWTAQLPIDFPDTDWRNRVSAIKDGVVYATRSGNTNYTYMYALDAQTGQVLWKSEDVINESSTESTAFAMNGDLIVGSFDYITRINYQDGTTIWTTDRSAPTSNGQEVSVFGNKGYYWESSPQGPTVSVIDLETGSVLYASQGLLGSVQQLGLMVAPDGVIYAPRTQNNPITDSLFAFKDEGTGLTKLWAIPLAHVPFATFGVGPDGSVYSYSNTGKVLRINPLTGALQDSSITIFGGTSPSPRIAIDVNGLVYVTNDNGAISALYSFNPDLSLRWSDPIPSVNVGGPAIGIDGTLVICGIGSTMKAYAGTPCVVSVKENHKKKPEITVFPNPATDFIRISEGLQEDAVIEIRKLSGELIQTLHADRNPHKRIDIRHLPAGSYIVSVTQNDLYASQPLVILR